MQIYWTYREDHILLDENLTEEEKRELLQGKRLKARKRYLDYLGVTKDELDKEKQVIVDLYPDYNKMQIEEYLGQPANYARQRIRDVEKMGLFRKKLILTEKNKEYIELNKETRKEDTLAAVTGLPLNLVKMVIFESYKAEGKEYPKRYETKPKNPNISDKEIDNKVSKKDKMPKKMILKEQDRPPQALDKRKLNKKTFKLNGLYEITKNLGKQKKEKLKGRLIYQNEEFILLEFGSGYRESFQKVDFEIGHCEIKEVI